MHQPIGARAEQEGSAMKSLMLEFRTKQAPTIPGSGKEDQTQDL